MFQVLEFVNLTIEADGTAPSYEMICDALGISSRGKVCDIVQRLEKRGLLSLVGKGRVRRISLQKPTEIRSYWWERWDRRTSIQNAR